MTKYKIQLKDAEGNLYYPNTLSDALPIGSMIPYSSEVIPNGFLPCDGSEVSRTAYKELFAVIGITYGAGDGETTFNLPDKRGRVSVGLDENQEEFGSIGLKRGEKAHTLTVDEMPEHNHEHREWVFNGSSASGAHYGFGYQVNTGGPYDRDEYGTTGEVQFGNYPTGGDKPHNNLQPYEVDQWIIKAFNGGYSQSVNGDVNDTLPVGSIIEFEGDYIPDGYEEVEKEVEKPSIEFYTAGTSFTAKWGCYAEVFVTAYGWGYGGAEAPLEILKSGDPEIILEQLGKTKGHDTVPDCVTSFGVYRLKKGNTYMFTSRGYLSGGGGGGAGYVKLTPIN